MTEFFRSEDLESNGDPETSQPEVFEDGQKGGVDWDVDAVSGDVTWSPAVNNPDEHPQDF